VLLQILEWMPRDNEHKEVRYLCVLQAAANVAARQPGFSVEEGWAAAGANGKGKRGRRRAAARAAGRGGEAAPGNGVSTEARGLSSPQAWSVYHELYTWSPDSADRAAVAARKHLLLYAALGRESLAAHPEGRYWRYYPKMHVWLHAIEGLKLSGNLMDSWCYADESMIGAAARLAASSHPRTMGRTAMTKYRLGRLVDAAA
jgi:hypothetical protein